MPVHASVFLDYGTECINRGRQHQPPVSERCFKAHFKLTPNACRALYQRLLDHIRPLSTSYLYPKVRFDNTEPRHLLWVLHHFFTNPTEEIGSSFFGVTPKTYRKYVWVMAYFLQELSSHIVSLTEHSTIQYLFCPFVFSTHLLYFWQVQLNNRYIRSTGCECLMTIDGIDLQINEPTQFDPLWFSHKFNGPALRYEVGVSIQTGWIVWIHGPFPAGDFPDIEIFRLGLYDLLAPNERVEADMGYSGDDKTRNPNDFNDNIEWRYQKGKARARHEAVNGKMKQFKILSSVFIGNRNRHYIIFNAIAAIVQSEIFEGRIVFELANYDVRKLNEARDGEADEV